MESKTKRGGLFLTEELFLKFCNVNNGGGEYSLGQNKIGFTLWYSQNTNSFRNINCNIKKRNPNISVNGKTCISLSFSFNIYHNPIDREIERDET